MDPEYQAWYNGVFGAPVQQGPAPGPAPLSPSQWADFYNSVGIQSPIGQSPATRLVQSVPMSPQGNATTIATYSTKPQVSGNMSYAGQEAGPRPALPQLAQAYIPGPSGYTNNAKGQERLLPSLPSLPGDSLMAAIAASNPGQTQVANGPPKVAPVPFPPYYAVASEKSVIPPMPVPRPSRSMPVPPMPIPRPAPLSITVSGANPIPQPARAAPRMTSAVQSFANMGLSPQQAYDAANAAAAERARNNAGSGGYSTIISPGGQRYDATTGNWV